MFLSIPIQLVQQGSKDERDTTCWFQCFAPLRGTLHVGSNAFTPGSQGRVGQQLGVTW